jgi:hypothetical protein
MKKVPQLFLLKKRMMHLVAEQVKFEWFRVKSLPISASYLKER